MVKVMLMPMARAMVCGARVTNIKLSYKAIGLYC